MPPIAEELAAKLQSLDESRAMKLTRMVQDAIAAIESLTQIDPMLGVENGWPVGYFARTAGALAGDPIERPAQGDLPERNPW